jgi:hypothetical protein
MDRRGERMTDIESHQERRSDAARVALEEAFKRFPTWEVDWDNAIQAQASTILGYEKLREIV